MGIDDFLIQLVKYCTDIFFDVYLEKWNYRAIPKVKTWSYFLTIPYLYRLNARRSVKIYFLSLIFAKSCFKVSSLL